MQKFSIGIQINSHINDRTRFIALRDKPPLIVTVSVLHIHAHFLLMSVYYTYMFTFC